MCVMKSSCKTSKFLSRLEASLLRVAIFKDISVMTLAFLDSEYVAEIWKIVWQCVKAAYCMWVKKTFQGLF